MRFKRSAFSAQLLDRSIRRVSWLRLTRSSACATGVRRYTGDPSVVDRFLAAIDARLPPDWAARDSANEQTRLQPGRCYLLDKAGEAAVRVWLHRVTASRARGGPVQLVRYAPSGDARRAGRMVTEFADCCVLPAANEEGIRCTRPTFGSRSALTQAAEMLFTRFADIADGKWPLKGQSQRSWDDLRMPRRTGCY